MLLGCAFAAGAGSWAILGFAGMLQYPKLLADLSSAEGLNSSSTAGLAHALGASPVLGEYAGVVLGVVAAALAFRAGLGQRRDAAFTLAIVASLLASPIVWTHYLVLLFLPLAVRAPRFNALWLVPLPMWIGSPIAANGHIWAFLATWPCLAIIVVAALRPTHATRSSPSLLELVARPEPPMERKLRAAA